MGTHRLRIMLTVLGLAALLACAPVASAGSAEVDREDEVLRATLENGLRVVIVLPRGEPSAGSRGALASADAARAQLPAAGTTMVRAIRHSEHSRRDGHRRTSAHRADPSDRC